MTKFKIVCVIFAYLSVISILIVNQYINTTPTPHNFLILGLDPRDDLLEKTETTDTIIFANLSTKFDSIKLFSLPRDLWFYPKSQKINQIYPDALITSDSFNYLQNSFDQLVGQKIDKTIVVTTKNLKDITSIIGGIDVYLDTELKDEKYPNQAYIDNPKSGAPIYKTIFYPVGKNHLDSSNITEYVRSRKSTELASTGGTDLGRIVRQQKLFDALLSKVMEIRNPKMLFSLYQYFDQNVSHNLSKKDYLILGLNILPNIKNIKIVKINIPTGENPKSDTIYHPQTFINKQWVFITSTPDYQSLKTFITKSIGM